MNDKNVNNLWDRLKPWISSIILLPIVVYFSINSDMFHFIDYLNLLIHEGGHGVFSFFGRFIYTLGGTLAQIIIPGMFVVYYWNVRKKILTQIFLVWLGENFLNISIYAADAMERKLPLLGGNKVYHDWTYLLNETGLILYSKEVGLVFYTIGILLFALAISAPMLFVEYNSKKIQLDL